MASLAPPAKRDQFEAQPMKMNRIGKVAVRRIVEDHDHLFVQLQALNLPQSVCAGILISAVQGVGW